MRAVKPLLQILGLVLALAWVPITSHCSWERVLGGDMFKCAPAPEQGDCSSENDNCAAVEAGSYKLSNTRLEIPALVLLAEMRPGCVRSAFAFPPLAPPTAAPVEITALGRFVSRLALPPRAPCLAS